MIWLGVVAVSGGLLLATPGLAARWQGMQLDQPRSLMTAAGVFLIVAAVTAVVLDRFEVRGAVIGIAAVALGLAAALMQLDDLGPQLDARPTPEPAETDGH